MHEHTRYLVGYEAIRGIRSRLSSLRNFREGVDCSAAAPDHHVYDKYGGRATRTFGADRKVISRWRKKLGSMEEHLKGWYPSPRDLIGAGR